LLAKKAKKKKKEKNRQKPKNRQEVRFPELPEFKIRPVGNHAQPGRSIGFSGSAPFRQ
jgi:hypothetical protein